MDVDQAIKANLEWPQHQLLAHRAAVFKGWLKKAAELKSEGSALHEKLPQHLQKSFVAKSYSYGSTFWSVWAMVMQRLWTTL